jgi:hypothetical protein
MTALAAYPPVMTAVGCIKASDTAPTIEDAEEAERLTVPS